MPGGSTPVSYTASRTPDRVTVPESEVAGFVGDGRVKVTYGVFSGVLASDGFLGQGDGFTNVNTGVLELRYAYRPALRGTGRDDRIEGSSKADVLVGRDGDDRLGGGSGRDVLYGDDDADRLDGGRGDDELHGGRGDDRLAGGDGRDRLQGGTGRDALAGGDGRDVFVFGPGDGSDRIGDFEGGDRIDLRRYDDLDRGDLGIRQAGDDVRVGVRGGATITLDDTSRGEVTSGDFLF